MKKILALALVLLMLCGCAAEPPEPTTASIPATEEPVISYDSLELLEFEYADVFAAAPMGDDLLLMSGMDSTTLIKISGSNHKEIATFSAQTAVCPDGPGVQITEGGVCYAAESEYIFLDENLEEIQRVTLSDAWGLGVVTADLQSIYYSTGSQLRVFNRETGLDRLLRDTTYSDLRLESLELNDSVLACQTEDAILFYSAATGELLEICESAVALDSAGDLWMAKISDSRRNQIVIGGSGASQVLTDWESFSDVTLVQGGALIKTVADNTSVIRFLNLTDNTEAAVALEGTALITNAWNAGGILWIALDDGRLCRWEPEDTETLDAIFCMAPHFTREDPDSEGLATLEPDIQELESTYGVKIHIFEDAVAVGADGMTLSSEYEVAPLRQALETLEVALAKFSPEFLGTLGKSSDDGKVHLCLVRAVRSDGCIQFWDEEGVARIVLTVDDQLEKNLYHGVGHIIDARVLSKCTAFDGWKSLNPKDFRYSYDFTAQGNPDDFPGIFTDSLAMTSPVEDRASAFAHAMLSDGSVFESDPLQKKLSTLCSGIRKAFGLKNSGEVFPWEQYLTP